MDSEIERGLEESTKSRKEIIAIIIVDLYEMRASVNLPLQAREIQRIENVFQYNFFNVAIAKLCDKYKINNQDIENVLRERSMLYK